MSIFLFVLFFTFCLKYHDLFKCQYINEREIKLNLPNSSEKVVSSHNNPLLFYFKKWLDVGILLQSGQILAGKKKAYEK